MRSVQIDLAVSRPSAQITRQMRQRIESGLHQGRAISSMMSGLQCSRISPW